jgi:hypothetical protein
MGVSHGSPYGYDRFVPLFVRGPTRPQSDGATAQLPVPFTRFHEALVRMIRNGAKAGDTPAQ